MYIYKECRTKLGISCPQGNLALKNVLSICL